MSLKTKSASTATAIECVVVDQTNSPDRLLTAAAVKARCGDISDMSLWRWTKCPDLNFPVPYKIQRVRYWSENELEAWLKTQRETSNQTSEISD